jgi:oxalate decarboxylase/phosphoglucose isomerase-like protein (cupin superfamily)
MKFSLKKFKGETLSLKVKDAVKEGKNIYKNTKGHENEINQVLIDLSDNQTGFKRLSICMNTLYPGKVNGEFRMTRGHSHDAEEVYLILKGKGYVIFDNKKINVNKDNLLTVPENTWHRTVNTGKEKLVFLTIFEKSEHQHLNK